MTLTPSQKVTLGLASGTAFGIGAVILTAPQAFYASYGISLGDDVNLLSELRAPAAGLAGFGILMLAGILRSAMAPLSITVALTVFLAFPAGRLIGLVVDGMPSGGMIVGLAVELSIAALCLMAFRHRLATPKGDGRLAAR